MLIKQLQGFDYNHYMCFLDILDATEQEKSRLLDITNSLVDELETDPDR